jgi:ribose transport system substrate-binding protein
MRKGRHVLALLAMAACFGPMSCGGPEQQAEQRPVRIAIVTNAVAPFWNPMKIGMERASKKLGCEAGWYGPEHGIVSEQRRILEDCAAQRFDAVSVSPIDAKAIGPVINDMVNKGIIVITMDSDAPATARKAYIGTNNFKAGREAGRQAKKVMPKGTRLIAFVGILGAMNAQERLAGFRQVTRGWIQVVDVMEDQTDKTRARKNVEDAIQAHPEVAGFLGLWSYNGPAIAAAVTEAGKRRTIKIVCFDAEPVTLQALERGEIDATIVQKPYMFGYLSVMVSYNMARMGVEETQAILPPDGIVDTGVEVVTPATVDEYKRELEKLGIKSS